jgi:hypothetical protein
VPASEPQDPETLVWPATEAGRLPSQLLLLIYPERQCTCDVISKQTGLQLEGNVPVTSSVNRGVTNISNWLKLVAPLEKHDGGARVLQYAERTVLHLHQKHTYTYRAKLASNEQAEDKQRTVQ